MRGLAGLVGTLGYGALGGAGLSLACSGDAPNTSLELREQPIIRGTRISVELILEWIASGATRDDVVRRHPQLTGADVEQALGYAAAAVRNEVLLTTQVAG